MEAVLDELADLEELSLEVGSLDAEGTDFGHDNSEELALVAMHFTADDGVLAVAEHGLSALMADHLDDSLDRSQLHVQDLQLGDQSALLTRWDYQDRLLDMDLLRLEDFELPLEDGDLAGHAAEGVDDDLGSDLHRESDGADLALDLLQLDLEDSLLLDGLADGDLELADLPDDAKVGHEAGRWRACA